MRNPALRSPPDTLPQKSQFFLLCKALHNHKNWLFFGSVQGGHAAAALFTLSATCRRLQLDPYAYLTDVFERFPQCNAHEVDSLMPLLPDRWLAEHPEAKLEFRTNEAAEAAARKRETRTQRRGYRAEAG